jgi:hypothetical protein
MTFIVGAAARLLTWKLGVRLGSDWASDFRSRNVGRYPKRKQGSLSSKQQLLDFL